MLISSVSLICLLFWFLSAPHIRFGKPYLLIPVFLCIGLVFSGLRIKENVVVSITVMTILLTIPLTDLFNVARGEERHFIWPVDYESYDLPTTTIGDIQFYIMTDDFAGYYEFPAVSDSALADLIEL